jgi:hypothetical protein
VITKLTLTIPLELRKRMAQLPGINWSKAARMAFEEILDNPAKFYEREAVLARQEADEKIRMLNEKEE